MILKEEAQDIRILSFGHASDGNLHVYVYYPTTRLIPSNDENNLIGVKLKQLLLAMSE